MELKVYFNAKNFEMHAYMGLQKLIENAYCIKTMYGFQKILQPIKLTL